MKKFLLLCGVALAAALLSPAADAQRVGAGVARGGGVGRGPADFHGRDYAHLSPGEARIWDGGYWVHDWHGGRYAWWWVVGGFWYFYPAPIYPYPDYIPPAVVIAEPPPVPTGMPPAQYWYYCDSPHGYYPYVASCNVPWRGVPVAPQAQTPAAPPQ